jgi:hypothetical protein
MLTKALVTHVEVVADKQKKQNEIEADYQKRRKILDVIQKTKDLPFESVDNLLARYLELLEKRDEILNSKRPKEIKEPYLNMINLTIRQYEEAHRGRLEQITGTKIMGNNRQELGAMVEDDEH